MKRILPLLLILCLSEASYAQLHQKDIVTLNEIYTDPSTGYSEFIELYNSSLKSVNMDDYTILLYYTTSSSYGFYVLDLPNATVTRDSFYVLASTAIFSTQANNSITANFNWSSVVNAASGNAFLQKYEYNASAAKYDSLTVSASEINNIMVPRSGSGGQYHLLVYDEGTLVNFFVGGGDNNLPSYVNTWKDLTVPFRRTGKSDSTLKLIFSALQTDNVKAVNSNTGSNNGYCRSRDGQCGTWVKSSSGSEHTPGRTNGSTSATGSLTVSSILSQAASNVNALSLAYKVASSTDPNAWPIAIRVVNDYTPGLDNPVTTTIADSLLPEGPSVPFNDVDVEEAQNPGVNSSGVPDARYTYPIPIILKGDTTTKNYLTSPVYMPNLYRSGFSGTRTVRAFHVFFICNSGCIDQVKYAQMTGFPILPVEFKSFTAKRNNDQVQLNWQTASEHSNAGFAIERNTTGQWMEIAFVPSLATGGNSDVPLNYQYFDNNPNKGISQYRIRQTDLSDKTTYSAIRSVQGDGAGTKLVIYPNPSFDGRVQVVFQDANAVRHLVITDMGGRIVRQFNNINTPSVTVDRLTAGLYTARVIDQSTGESILQKFVVQQK